MLESTSDCVCSLDRKWRITYLNGPAIAYFNAGDELLGKSILKVIPGARHSVFRECFESAMQKRLVASAEGLLASTGRWYELRVTPSDAGVTVFFRDITDRKALEEAQRTASERWRATLDVIPQMVWSMPAGAGRPDFYNRRWYEFTGLSPGLRSGPDWGTLLHPDDQQATLATWRRCRATGEPYEAQYRLRHKSGEYRWIISRGHVETDASGEHVRWYGTCTDVHERVVQGRRLAASERQVQQILNSVPQVIWASGPDGQLDFVSSQRDRLYTEGSERVLGAGWLEIVHPDDRAQAIAAWSSSLASGTPYEAEFRLKQLSGDYAWALVRALPEKNEQGEIVRWYGTCTDIHQQVLVQAALQESEALNRGIIEASPDCMWLLDRSGQVLFVNQATVSEAGRPGRLGPDRAKVGRRAWRRSAGPIGGRDRAGSGRPDRATRHERRPQIGPLARRGGCADHRRQRLSRSADRDLARHHRSEGSRREGAVGRQP
jgi:PAS domain S-box-containing protein